jgi:hypothetical protein
MNIRRLIKFEDDLTELASNDKNLSILIKICKKIILEQTKFWPKIENFGP